jgi:hypothetical protein
MEATFQLTIDQLLVVDELPDEALWENYPDLKAHEPLFRGAWLISKAFPQVFAEPEIGRVDLRLAPHNEAARKRIAQPDTIWDTHDFSRGRARPATLAIRLSGALVREQLCEVGRS